MTSLLKKLKIFNKDFTYKKYFISLIINNIIINFALSNIIIMDEENLNRDESENSFGPDSDLSFLEAIVVDDGNLNDDNEFSADRKTIVESKEEEEDSEGLDSDEDDINDFEEIQTADKFFKSLHEKGITSLPVELIDEYRAKISNDEELLATLFEEDKRHYAERYYTEEFKKRFSEETQLAIEAELSGVDIDHYNQLNSTHKYLTSIRDEHYGDENFVKRTLAYKFQSRGSDEESAFEQAEAVWNLNKELAKSDALEFNENAKLKIEKELNSIFPEAEKRKREEQEKLQNEVIRFESNLKEYIEKRNEIIPGIPMNGIVKNKIVDAAMYPIGVNQYGEKYGLISDLEAKDPVGFVAKINFLALLGVFDDKIGFSKIKEIFETQKTLNKKNEYRGSASSSSSSSYYNQPKKTNKNKSADDPHRF